MSDLPPFNPSDRRLRNAPYGLFDQYRELDPVHWSESAEALILTRHRDVSAVLRNPSLEPASVSSFSDAVGKRLGREWPALRSFIAAVTFLDATSGHRQARRLLAATLNHRPLGEFAPMIAEVTEELLAPLDGCRSFDVVEAFANPVPFRVMCAILGVPKEIGDEIFRVSRPVLRLFNFILGARELDHFERWVSEAYGHIGTLVAERRRVPRPDGISRLLQLASSEEGVDDLWLNSRILFLLLVGAETTSAFLASAIRMSLEEPEVAMVARDPSRAAQAVEELLRLDSPVMLAVRRTMADTEVAGRALPAGTVIIPYLTSANRDPEAYPEPGRFRPGRPGPGHLGFGEGTHACLGNALARLEGRVVLPLFFARQPTLARAEAADDWVPLDTFRRLARLAVTAG